MIGLRTRVTRPFGGQSLEIVNHNLLNKHADAFLNELQVQRMHLIFVLCFLVCENQIEPDLIRLIHHWSVTRRHFTDVKLKHPGDRLQPFLRTGDDFIRSSRLRRIRPKNDNV